MQTHLALVLSLLLPSTFALPDPTSSSLLISESIFDSSRRDGGRFIREAGNGDITTSTEKCPEAKYEDFFSRYGNCMNAAEAIVDEVRVDQSVITCNQSISSINEQ